MTSARSEDRVRASTLTTNENKLHEYVDAMTVKHQGFIYHCAEGQAKLPTAKYGFCCRRPVVSART